MKKSDLKNNMIIETSDGDLSVLFDDKIICKTGFVDLSNYDEDLKSISMHHLDIRKVYKFKNGEECLESIINKEIEVMVLLWERPKEIDWSKVPVGTKVIVSDFPEDIEDIEKIDSQDIGFFYKI